MDAKEKDLSFSLTIKNGMENLFVLNGRPVSPKVLTADDLQRVIEVEQYLERLLGYRFHINQCL